MSKKKAAAPTSKPVKQSPKTAQTWYIRHWYVLGLGALFVVVLAAFGRAFGHDFVSWDDQVYVSENPLILNPTAESFRALGRQIVSLNYHPLTMWSLWLNAAIWGMGAKSFIVGNVLIHWLNAGLLCWLVWLLTGRQYRSVALFTALLFAIHPLRVESVVWVSERKDVLYVFFFWAGCISYWLYLERQQRSKLWLATGLMLFSCLSKGMAVVFPLVCLLLDYWYGRRWSLSVFWEKLPMFALSLLFGLIALDVQKGGDFYGFFTLPGEKVKALASVFGFGQKVLFAGYGYTMYFVKTFLPLRLCTFYPYPTEAELRNAAYIGGAMFMFGTAALALWSAQRAKVVAFGFGWIFVTVILVLQFISVGVVIMADRYFYLPSAGLFFMLTYAAEFYWLRKKTAMRKVWWGVLGAFALWCLVLSRAQTSTWADSEALWKQVLRYYPKEDQALEPLANWYAKQGRVAEAEQMLELAVSDGSDRPIVFSALANCLAIKAGGTTDTAVQRALRERAFSLYARSLALNPKNADTYFNRAFTALSINPELSLADLDSAAAIAPYKALIFKQMKGTAFNSLKRYAEAEQILTEVIAGYEASAANLKIAEEKQRYADAYLERGLARFNAGKRPEGLADVEKSLNIVPQSQRATGVLGQMRQLMGQ